MLHDEEGEVTSCFAATTLDVEESDLDAPSSEMHERRALHDDHDWQELRRVPFGKQHQAHQRGLL